MKKQLTIMGIVINLSQKFRHKQIFYAKAPYATEKSFVHLKLSRRYLAEHASLFLVVIPDQVRH